MKMITGRLKNIDFKGVSIDTRTLQKGNLFFALKGKRTDGHDFIEKAYEKGAALAIVSRKIETDLFCVQVKDPVQALGKIAKHWREKFSLPLIGLTGSAGKTTVKNMIAAILNETGKPVLATRGNFNNPVGLPLTLAELNSCHQYAVIEMGMNHFQEIAYLTRLAKPATAVIVNAGPCHLEGAGHNLAGVAKAKGEIFEGLDKNGTAVINEDDDFAGYWKNLLPEKNIKIIAFGLDKPADVEGEVKNDGFILKYQDQAIFIRLNLLGRHNVVNALAAAAAALVNHIDLKLIKKGLEKILPEKGRMEMKNSSDSQIMMIDDAYNANPLSLKAAIASVQHFDAVKILVLGEMKELGEQAIVLHQDCGKFARCNGIDFLLAVGKLTQYTAESFGENAKYFETKQDLTDHLKILIHQYRLQKKLLILVKGSRSTAMEDVIADIENSINHLKNL